MKYLSGFNTFVNESSRLRQLGLVRLSKKQEEFLDEYIDGSWEFDTDTGLVNIDGNFFGGSTYLTDFKGIRFGRVKGDFWCGTNRLTSLEGAPQQVDGYFDCGRNGLTSLEGAPQEVGGNFYCNGNLLTNLEGAPQWIEGKFDCRSNRLTSLLGAPQQVGGMFDCDNNPDLESLASLPKLYDIDIPSHLIRRLAEMRAEAKKIKSEE